MRGSTPDYELAAEGSAGLVRQVEPDAVGEQVQAVTVVEEQRAERASERAHPLLDLVHTRGAGRRRSSSQRPGLRRHRSHPAQTSPIQPARARVRPRSKARPARRGSVSAAGGARRCPCKDGATRPLESSRPFRFGCRVNGGQSRTAAEWAAMARRAEEHRNYPCESCCRHRGRVLPRDVQAGGPQSVCQRRRGYRSIGAERTEHRPEVAEVVAHTGLARQRHAPEPDLLRANRVMLSGGKTSAVFRSVRRRGAARSAPAASGSDRSPAVASLPASAGRACGVVGPGCSSGRICPSTEVR
jgi:hypothetical protein